MRNARFVFGLSWLIAASAATADGIVEYRAATWWDGAAEHRGSRYVQEGRFVAQPGAGADRVVDLGGRLVTAPFAEGHNHNLVEAIFERSNAEYLRNGVFYVKIALTYPPAAHAIRNELARPDTVDAIFAMGAVTSPGGHPVPLYTRVLSGSLYGGAGYEDMRGQVFHEIETEQDVVAAVRDIKSQGADFLKAIVQYGEDYQPGSGKELPNSGMDPRFLPLLVREAHGRGLPVTVHVMSAFDFRAAIDAGVDEVTHLPGMGWPDGRDAAVHRLTAADAAAARAAGIPVVTTTAVIREVFRERPERLETFEDMQRHNLRLLRDAGVELRIGSDLYDRRGDGRGADPTRAEVENLVALGAFTPKEALERWIDTGRRIFPGRRIACFEPGCEASFLVFDADPREDIGALDSLRTAIKEGIVVSGAL